MNKIKRNTLIFELYADLDFFSLLVMTSLLVFCLQKHTFCILEDNKI